MAGFPSSFQSDLGARSSTGATMNQGRAGTGDPFRFSRPDRGIRQGASLAKMVESEIIPRLMLAHQAMQTPAEPRPEPRGPLSDDTTETFARMVVAKEPDSLIAYVGTLLQDGVSIESIFLDLLIPAARRLGDYWDEDSASFADVTIGLGRLQQVVRALGSAAPTDNGSRWPTPSALFATGPEEQHTFGLFIIEDSFRRAGWRTWIENAASGQDLADTVRAHWFDVFGLSASRGAHVDEISRIISGVRRSSRNRELCIMVGGRLFMERPELVEAVGADASAPTGAEALLIATEALPIANNGVRRVASGL